MLTITRGDGIYTKYKLPSGTADTAYASCRVSYVDPKTGKSIEGIAYAEDYDADDEDNQCLEITAKVSSIAEAETLAGKQLRLHNKYEKTASFTLMGNVAIVSGVTVTLTKWGAWNGKYIVKQAVALDRKIRIHDEGEIEKDAGGILMASESILANHVRIGVVSAIDQTEKNGPCDIPG